MASGATTTYGIPYPIPADPVDVAGDVQDLAVQIDALLIAKAPLDTPTFIGVPTAPTVSSSDNSTKIATTAFVKAQSYLTTTTAASTYAPIASPIFTGNVTMGANDFIMGNSLGDRVTIYGTHDAAASYALGIESNTLYYRSNGSHRWYIGVNADAGTSDTLELTSSALTSTVPAILPAATASIPSLRLPHGTAPSAPTNGDIWTTSSGIYARINGTTVGPFIGTTASSVTLSTSTINTSTLTSAKFIAPTEKWNSSATAITTTTTVDYLTAQNWRYTTASTAGACTVNIRGNSGTTLDSLLSVGDSITFSFHVATGATTPAYFNAVQIDGTATGVTVRWQYGTTPTSGTTSGFDMYLFTVIKTAAATYTVLASVAKW